MGEDNPDGYRDKFSFTDKVKAYFKGSEVTSDGGLAAIRELDEKLGLTMMAEKYLSDKRCPRNIQHELSELLRQSVYSRLAGYEDVNDADQLRTDPALRSVLSERAPMDIGTVRRKRPLGDLPHSNRIKIGNGRPSGLI